MIAELEGQIQIDPHNRICYSNFLEKYKEHIIEYISSMPLIHPMEWKKTMYVLTKYYPEIVKDIEPWKSDDQWSENILNTYHKLKYRSLWSRFTSGYYCLCKCINYNDRENNREHYYHEELYTNLERHRRHSTQEQENIGSVV